MRGARSGIVGALLVIVWSAAVPLEGVSGVSPPQGDRVAALAGADRRAPVACRRELRAGVAVVACDPRRRAPTLSARHRRARRAPGTRRVRTLSGSPLRAGEHVHVRRARRSSRTQLTAVAVSGATLAYARFRLPGRSGPSGILRVVVRGDRPSLRLAVGGRPTSPRVERWETPAEPTPDPSPSQAATPELTATPAPAPSGPVTFRECGSVAPVDATDAAGFDRLWHVERNGPGWTGGDGVFSVPIDDGRIAWLFGDSFIGGVLPDGRRAQDWHLVRNTVVVQDGACLTTAVGGTAEAPAALVRPTDPAAWYWPEEALAEGDTLHVMMLRVVRTGPTGWDFGVIGVDVADLDLRSFTTTAVRSLPVDGSVLWGSSVLEDGDAVYVYGVEDAPAGARVYLARAGSRALDGDWRFYRGGPAPWSLDPRDAVPLPVVPGDDGEPPAPLTGVSSAVTVVADGDGVLLVSQAPTFGTAVTARRAPRPEGPFGPPQLIAWALPPPASPDAFAYGARLHPQLAAEGLQLLSWNVSSFGDLLADASLYRPRFDAIEWPPPEGPRAGGPLRLR
jgi:hypothetical protein